MRSLCPGLLRLHILVGLTACSAGDKAAPTAGAPSDSADPDSGPSPDACVPALEVRRVADPELAEAGRALLAGGGLSSPLIPRVALDNLYWIWGGGRPADSAAFQQAFQARYGLLPDPSGGPYALGVPAVSSTMASLDCTYCHADGIAGSVVVGAGSGRADLQSC